jgi:AraC-like DNA-binding protein
MVLELQTQSSSRTALCPQGCRDLFRSDVEHNVVVEHHSSDAEYCTTRCDEIQFVKQGHVENLWNGMLSFWLIDGSAEFTRGGSTRTVSGAAIVGPESLYSGEWRGSWRAFALRIAPAYLAEMIPHRSSLARINGAWEIRLGQDDEQVIMALRAVQADFRCKTPVGSLFRDSIAQTLVSYLFARYRGSDIHAAATGRGLSPRNMRRICEYIDANVSQRLTLEMLAREVNMTVCNFSRQFKASKGIAPYQYVLQRRIELAKDQLRASNSVSIAELAASLGFYDQSQFATTFKRHVGMTPSDFADA